MKTNHCQPVCFAGASLGRPLLMKLTAPSDGNAHSSQRLQANGLTLGIDNFPTDHHSGRAMSAKHATWRVPGETPVPGRAERAKFPPGTLAALNTPDSVDVV
jgi:hypothetical protein